MALNGSAVSTVKVVGPSGLEPAAACGTRALPNAPLEPGRARDARKQETGRGRHSPSPRHRPSPVGAALGHPLGRGAGRGMQPAFQQHIGSFLMLCVTRMDIPEGLWDKRGGFALSTASGVGCRPGSGVPLFFGGVPRGLLRVRGWFWGCRCGVGVVRRADSTSC